MAHIHITGVKAGSWHELVQNWWQLVRDQILVFLP